jgi:hypothetical protein
MNFQTLHPFPGAKALFLAAYCCLLSPVVHSQGWIPVGEGLIAEDSYTWALSVVDENTVFAITTSLSVFEPKLIRTTDGGMTWDVHDLSAFGDPMDVHALHADTVWITAVQVTGEKSAYLSADGGNTWEPKYSFQGALVIGPALHFSNSKQGCMVDPNTDLAFYTNDGGESWLEAPMDAASLGSWGMASPTNWLEMKGDTIWWGKSQKIVRSANNGADWSAFDNGFSQELEISSIAFSQSGLGLAISGREDYTNLNTTYIQASSDGGMTWAETGAVPFHLEGVTDVPGLDDVFVGVGGILSEFLPTSPFVFSSAYTLDGGSSWTVVDERPYNGVEFVSSFAGWAGKVASYDYEGNPALFKWDGTDLSVLLDAKEPFATLNISTFPNPFSDHLAIGLPQAAEGICTLRDLSGRILRQERFEGVSIELSNLAQLPAGVYTVEIVGKDVVAVEKVVRR